MFDFALTAKKYVGGIGETAVYTHKSGGRLVCVDNDDKNCVFFLSFDTPAHDGTGIPHILEHCVLCGSEHFPVKDPFNMLCTNLSHTYLNAITFPHKTVFPAASFDEAALLFAARVYCDGVFYPLVYKNKGIFLQEGGYYDGERPNGVVYNEMCGLYDDPSYAAEQCLIRSFLPFPTAGIPSDIPNAKYEAMLDYHKTYYSPDNCVAFVYGSCDKNPYFELVDEYFKNGSGVTRKPFIYRFKKGIKHVPLPYDEKTAVIPLCGTNDRFNTCLHKVITAKIRKKLPKLDISFNAEGPVAYAKICGKDLNEDLIKNALYSDNYGDILDDMRYFYSTENFGYKPKGLFYGLKLLYAELLPESMDMPAILEKIECHDINSAAREGFFGNGIFSSKGETAEKKKTYSITDITPLLEYRRSEDKVDGLRFPLFERKEKTEAEFYGNSAYVPIQNKDIIFITLAFELKLPPKLLENAGILMKRYSGGLAELDVEMSDLGRPCVVINAGFLAKDREKAVCELNNVIKGRGGIYKKDIYKTPQYYTDLLALGAIDKNARILDRTCGFYSEPDEAYSQKVRQNVFTKQNLVFSVCCAKSNIEAAYKVVERLELYGGEAHETELPPESRSLMIPRDVNVNTLSFAFKPGGTYHAAAAACVILKNTYLWENVRNAGAYGCDCRITPGGNICMHSFKDPNFERTIDAFKGVFSYFDENEITDMDMHRFKVMCLNEEDRPKKLYEKNIYAIKKILGAPVDIRTEICGLTRRELCEVFENADVGGASTAGLVKATLFDNKT